MAMSRRQRRAVYLVAFAVLLAGAIATAYVLRGPLYRQLLLAQVAIQAASPNLSAEDEALSVLRHIKSVAGEYPKSVIDDDPAGTLIRGWAYCDGAANAFAQVGLRRGMEVRLVSLWDENEFSPHTVAEVMIDGKWRVFDLLEGTVSYTDDGELATSQDIAARRAEPTAQWINPEWFGNTQLFWQEENGGFKPYLRKGVWATARVLARAVGAPLQDLYLLSRPPVYRDVDGELWDDWTDSGARHFWLARNYHLFGRSDDALHAYAQIPSASRYREEADAHARRLAEARRDVARL